VKREDVKREARRSLASRSTSSQFHVSRLLVLTPPASAPADTGGLRVLLSSGGSTSVTYVVPEGGDLFLLCHLPGHQEREMVGQVVRVER